MLQSDSSYPNLLLVLTIQVTTSPSAKDGVLSFDGAGVSNGSFQPINEVLG